MITSATVLAFLASIAIKAAALVAMAAVLDLGILRRRASASSRHLLWSIVLGASLVLPVAGLVAPKFSVALPAAVSRLAYPATPAPRADLAAAMTRTERPTDATDGGVATRDERGRDALVREAPASAPITVAGDGQAASASAPSGRAFSTADIVLAVYLAGVAVLLGRVAAEQRIVRRLERDATPLRDVEWHALFHSVLDELRISRRVAMLHGAGNTMPLTWGVRRPAVLIPATAADWTESRRRAVLLHELAHVTRLDCLTQTVAAIVCAFYWPHPGLWWASRRLRIERELACDDQALRSGVGAHDYARHLLEIAHLHRVPDGVRALAVSMASRSHLESRLLAAIDGARHRAAPGRLLRAAGVSTAAMLLLPLAGLQGDTTAGAVAARTTRQATGVATLPDFTGEWAMRRASAEEVRMQGDGDVPHVHVMLWNPGMNTFLVRLDAIGGITASTFTSSILHSRFSLRRDAGTFTFTGTFANGQGRGRFVFTPSAAFADSLVRRGMERPTAEQQFSLARHGVDLDLLEELAKQGYARPTTYTFVASGLTGTDVRYVGEMSALGYRVGTLEALMHMANQGVMPAGVRALAALGYRDLPPDALVRLQNHSLDAPRVSELNERAGRRLDVDELVRLRKRGDEASVRVPAAAAPASATSAASTPASATSAASTPAPATVVSASTVPTVPGVPRASSTPLDGRWMIAPWSGTMIKLDLEWSDGNQWRRALPVAEMHGLTTAQISAARATSTTFTIDQDAGRFEFDGVVANGQGAGRFRFVPNHDFVNVLRSLGVRELGEVSDHQLKNLAFGGMSATALRGFSALGYGQLTKDEIIELAIRIVTPDYARDLRAAGVTGTDTVHNLIEAGFHGVTAQYAREMAALGYEKLSTRELTELWNAGVTPAFIRQLRASGEKQPSREELIQRMEEAKAQARRARRGS